MELTIPIKVEFSNAVQQLCKDHPTCEGCGFMIEHKGCYFRGKTPREWIDFEEIINAPNNL